jgi:lantibiotic biosynthesis protein
MPIPCSPPRTTVLIDRATALTAARSIAEHLCRSAYSHNGYCTWCGTVQDDDDWETATVHQTVGPDLYGGTSGIALFLGEAFAHLGDPRFRSAAEGGIAHALERLDMIPRESRFGGFTGVTGVAYAAVRLGQILDRPDLLRRGRDVIRLLSTDLDPPFLMDVIDGAAGAIPMLLTLADALESPELFACARTLGDAILTAASRNGDALSWGPASTGVDVTRDLTGLAHGAAGIGWSLLELYRRTDEPRFLEGAFSAFHYENRWFQPAEDNWPDFRWNDGSDEPAPCMVAWCHGAVGIGLARLAALRIQNDAWLRRDAEAAVRASKRALIGRDGPPDPDFCLCHGQAGIAAFLLSAGEILEDPEARELALATAASAAKRFAATPHAWPGGTRRGSSPSLMTGLAGIGCFYLGLAGGRPPSVPLFRP